MGSCISKKSQIKRRKNTSAGRHIEHYNPLTEDLANNTSTQPKAKSYDMFSKRRVILQDPKCNALFSSRITSQNIIFSTITISII